MLSYSIVKALHIIFVVSYFAGIFYIVRLFIYHTEALQESEPKRSILHQQFSYMEERLWNIITVPAYFGYPDDLYGRLGFVRNRLVPHQVIFYFGIVLLSLLVLENDF